MTIDQFVARQGLIYQRARVLQRRFDGMAACAVQVGCADEAARLRAIGQRAWVLADQLIDRAFLQVA